MGRGGRTAGFALGVGVGAGLVGLAGVGFVVGCAPATDPGPRPTTVDLDTYATGLAAATATARREAGVEPLETSRCATRAAARRAEALVGHPLEHAPLAAVLADCAPATTAAENLSRAPADAGGPADVVAAWLDSPGHRANLLDADLTAVGVTCVPDDSDPDVPQVLCSQVFLGP